MFCSTSPCLQIGSVMRFARTGSLSSHSARALATSCGVCMLVTSPSSWYVFESWKNRILHNQHNFFIGLNPCSVRSQNLRDVMLSAAVGHAFHVQQHGQTHSSIWQGDPIDPGTGLAPTRYSICAAYSMLHDMFVNYLFMFLQSLPYPFTYALTCAS